MKSTRCVPGPTGTATSAGATMVTGTSLPSTWARQPGSKEAESTATPPLGVRTTARAVPSARSARPEITFPALPPGCPVPATRRVWPAKATARVSPLPGSAERR